MFDHFRILFPGARSERVMRSRALRRAPDGDVTGRRQGRGGGRSGYASTAPQGPTRRGSGCSARSPGTRPAAARTLAAGYSLDGGGLGAWEQAQQELRATLSRGPAATRPVRRLDRVPERWVPER
jgi:hypothetical protein